MATETKEITLFEELYSKDISKYTEKLKKTYKDKYTGEEKSFYLTYLSWAYGHREMKRIDENATEVVHEFPLIQNGQVIEGVTVPYLATPQGYFVKSSVTILGRTETEWLPVLDNGNKYIPNPNSFQINTSNKRCFVKALAKHGLGLYLYVGEDLPENIAQTQKTEEEPINNDSNIDSNEEVKKVPTQKELEKEANQKINTKYAEIQKLNPEMTKERVTEHLKKIIGVADLKGVNKGLIIKQLDMAISSLKQTKQGGDWIG